MKLPQIRRLLVEDFMDQKDWISKLFIPLNNFMDGVMSCLEQGINITDNMAASVKVVTLTFSPTPTNPVIVSWGLKSKPIAVHVGNVLYTNGTSPALTAAVQVQWTYSATSGVRLTNIVGTSPSNAIPIVLTLVCFTG